MKARHPWLRRIGWLLLLLALVVAGLVARYALHRREHLKLQEAEATRAPVVSPRRARPVAPAPTSPSATPCLRGRVTDHGAPVPGMLVSASAVPPAVTGACPCPPTKLACGCREGLELLVAQPRAGLVEGVESATTDAQGAFELCGVAAGVQAPLTWGEHVDGRLALPALASTGGGQSGDVIELRVEPLVQVEGVVLEDQAPVPGATVHAYASPPVFVRSFITDGRGRFSARLPRQVSAFVVGAPTRPAQRLEQGFAPNQVLVLRLRGASPLSVRAVEAGTPVPGATVTVGDEPPAVTDGQGLARFSVTAGRYRVSGLKGELTGSMAVALLDGKPLQVDLALEAGVRVRGVVRDEDGQPRAGARVRGFGASPPVITDARGRFESAPVQRGLEYSPVASADGCADSPYHPVEARAEEVELVVACRETVTGSVLDAEGRPIAGASVFLDGAQRGEDCVTDAAGAFRFHLPPGAAQLKVRHDDYRATAQPLIVPARDVTVVLDAGGSLSGRVVDGAGAGIAGADLTAVPALLEQLLGDLEASNSHASTDAEGNFHLSGLSAGRLAISATASSRGVVVSDVVVLQPGEHRAGLTLVLDEKVDLQGTVRDEQQRPIAGARVEWVPADEKATLVSVVLDAVRGRVDELLRYMPSPSFSDADGRFEVRGLPLSKVKVTISAPGSDDVERLASRGDSLDVVLAPRGLTLAGRVVDEVGRPVTQFELDGATYTPADGRFEVRVDRGPHALRIRAVGFSDFQREYELKGTSKDLGDVVLTKAIALVVEVKGAGGAPLERADVRVTQGGGASDSCRTGPDGRCTLDTLGPVAALLAVRREGYVPHDQPLTPADLTAPLAVTLAVAGGKLTGEVFALPGRPAVARTVYVAGTVNQQVTTDADGRFVAEGLPEGRYCLTLEGPSFQGAEWAVTAEASASPSPVRLGPAANGAVVTGKRMLPGRLVLARDASGPLGGRAVGDLSATTGCERLQTSIITLVTVGEYRIEGVPPGRWGAYFVDVTELDSQAEVQPVVLDLLPGDTKRLP